VMAHQFIAPEVASGFTCLVGPPGSGVTTTSIELACYDHPAAAVFSRSSDRRTSSTSPAIASAPGLSLLGGAKVASSILRMVLVHVKPDPSIGSVAVLPHSPANAEQLRLLHVITQTVGMPLNVIELDASDLVLAGRMYARRSCSTCGHVRHGESFDDFGSDGLFPDCGERCADWRPAEIHAFLNALHAYRLRRPGLRHAASKLGVPWVRLESSSDRGTRISAVRNALAALVTGDPLPQVAHDAVAVRSSPVARPRDSPPAPTRPLARQAPCDAESRAHDSPEYVVLS